MAAEDYNQARDRYDKLTRQVRRAGVKLTALRKHMTTLQGALNHRADNMYRSGPLGFLEVLLEAKSFEDFSTTWDVLTDVSEKDAATVAELKSARKESEATLKALKAAQANAAAQKKAMAAHKKEVNAQLAQRRVKLAGITADVRALIAAQKAADEAEARARVIRARRGSSRLFDVGGDPPSNASRGEKVVFYAMSQRGKPYRWGASGPNSYDCSGLTMWAYAKVGVSIPRVSRAQYSASQHVSRANLEPGDLVFFGRSRIHHVGIYIGGGSYVHAPSTGDVVKVSSLGSRSDFVGGGRP